MFFLLLRRVLGISGLIVALSVGVRSHADEPIADLRAAVDAMHDWLSADADAGRAWCQFLKSDRLQTQLVLGDGADAGVVGRINARYAGDTAGLGRRRFVAVRQALEAWHAELLRVSNADLVSVAQEEAERFEPVAEERIAAAKASLRDAVAELDEYLRGGSEARQQGWRTFLKWDELVGQLADSAESDTRILELILRQYISGEEGLERPAFAAVRRALLRYLQVVSITRDQNASRTYATQLQQLAQTLDKYATEPSAQAAGQIGRVVEWLDDIGQAPNISQMVRRRYSNPNLLMQVSGATVSAFVDRSINEPVTVRDEILGTAVRGQGVAQADVRAQLVRSCQSAALDVAMVGSTTTDTIGFNGPVRVNTAGLTQLRAQQRLSIDVAGLSTLPAEADCHTSTRFRCITADSCLGKRLIERIAWKRACRDKARAERIAARHAEDRLTERMNEESGELTDNANRRYSKEIRGRLARADVFPARVQFSSTDTAIWVSALQASPAQLGAPRPPDALDSRSDITLWLHESFVNNSAEAVVGGMTLSDERLVELLEENDREVPEELQITEDTDPWSITFARRNPFRVTFDADRVTMAIRGERFRRGSREDGDVLVNPIEISATYQLAVGKLGAHLTREGDVDVQFPNVKGRLSATQIGVKTFMRRKFGAMFKEEFIFEGIKLPERMQQRVRQLRLGQISARDGWFSGGWNRSDDDATAIASAHH